MKTFSNYRPSKGVALARSLRKRGTPPERILWQEIRNRRLGTKFRRQVPVGKFVVDFLSVESRLIIEVDGAQHGTHEMQMSDRERDIFLRGEGYEVIRFSGFDIHNNCDACLLYLGERVRRKLMK